MLNVGVTAVSISVVHWRAEMRLLLITILVTLQRSSQGSEFVLLETETEGDTGNVEDSEPASSSNGDYQDNPTMDVSNQDKFGCQDCNMDMTPMYGHTPCTGCQEENSQGSPFSCRSCVPGELQKFKCDDCQRNGNGRILMRVDKLNLHSQGGQFEYYSVMMKPWVPGTDICETISMRSVCNMPGALVPNMDKAAMCKMQKQQRNLNNVIINRAICANRIVDNPNPRTGTYGLDAGKL